MTTVQKASNLQHKHQMLMTNVKIFLVANGRSWDSALKRRSEIWSTYYQPVVTAHVQSLVEAQWKTALATLRERLADSLRETLRER